MKFQGISQNSKLNKKKNWAFLSVIKVVLPHEDCLTFVNAFLNYLTYKKWKKKYFIFQKLFFMQTCNLLAIQLGFLSFVSIVLWFQMSFLIQHSLSGPNFLSYCRSWGMTFSKKQLFLLFSPRYPSDHFQWFDLFIGLLLSCYHPQSILLKSS